MKQLMADKADAALKKARADHDETLKEQAVRLNATIQVGCGERVGPGGQLTRSTAHPPAG